jgi:uncharacterized membrane protein HdeD (DUF308 family)
MRGLCVLRDTIKHSWWGAILAEHDTEPVELIGGGTKVAMGVWLLLPLQSFSSSPTFAALAILPEWVWGLFLLCVGIFHLAALHNGHRGWRKWAAVVGFLVWFSFGTVFVWTNPPAIGWIMFLAIAAAQMWASIRLGSPA